MKNNETKRRLTSLFPAQNPAATSAVDVQKMELESEITKVEQMLSHEYTSASRGSLRVLESNFEEEKKLHKELNKLRSVNKAKEHKITGLMDLIKCYTVISPRTGSSFNSLTSNIYEDDDIEKIREQLAAEEKKIDDEEMDTEVLIESKNKAIQNTLVWKERLYGLSKLHKEIETKYTEVLDTKQKACLSLLSAQNELTRFKKFVEKNKEQFETAIKKRKAIKEKDELDVKESISKISRVNLKSRESKSFRTEMLKQLEEKVKSNEMKSDQIRNSKEEISVIRKQLQAIKMFIPECKGFMEPLSEKNVNFIISAYSKLKFQEHSLSVKFQNLTEEQAEKQRKFDQISEEIEKLKESESDSSSLQAIQGLTYNQIRQFMEADGYSAKTKVFEESQVILMKVYLNTLNLGNILCRSLQVISHNSSFHQQENTLVYSMNVIKKSQQGISHKQDKEIKDCLKASVKNDKKKTFKTEVDVLDEYLQFSISISDIEEMLGKVVGNEKMVKKLAKIIKADSVSCLFLDLTEVELKFAKYQKAAKELVVEINVAGNIAFKEKTSQLTTAISDIVKSVRRLYLQNKKEIEEFHESYKERFNQERYFNDPLGKDPPRFFADLNEKMKNKVLRKNDEEPQKFKVLDTAKTIPEENNPKSRQEIPKSVNLSKANQKEIMNELNAIRIKVSNFKSKERQFNSSSHKAFGVMEDKKPWFKRSIGSSLSSSRPLTVGLHANLSG